MENESKQGPSLPEEVQAEPSTEGATDWKAMARKWERLAKSNSEKAAAYDELQEASKTEFQKAQEKAKRAEDELAELKAKAELAEHPGALQERRERGVHQGARGRVVLLLEAVRPRSMPVCPCTGGSATTRTRTRSCRSCSWSNV